MRLGRVCVEHHGGGGARRCLAPDLGRSEHAVVREQTVRVRKTGVGESGLGIFDKSLLEEV